MPASRILCQRHIPFSVSANCPRQALAGAAELATLLDRSAVVLGASGIGFAVLGALLYSSRAEIRCVSTLHLRTQMAEQGIHCRNACLRGVVSANQVLLLKQDTNAMST